MLTRKQREENKLSKDKSNFKITKRCLGSSKIILRSQQKFGSTLYNIFRENINKIAFNENDEWWETSNVRVILNLYDTDPGRVCEEELMKHLEIENWV